jgi:geranylgeranyl pyrophosphate synthase
MRLKEIYQPIEKELDAVERVLKDSLGSSRHKSILEINNYLLNARGKRLRPALVILSAKATLSHKPSTINHQLIKVASAIELIHMASLIHDDVIDHACLRQNKPTINSKYGQEASIAMGDYLYSIGFELVSSCNNPDILSCIASATKAMCEGELIQVCERDNLDLLKKRYVIIAKKKTASLFVASCQAGAMLISSSPRIQNSLKGYGLNFGIAFQIIDDYLDLIGQQKDLGKTPGADFKMGELTLPVLNLLTQTKDRNRLISLIKQQGSPGAFKELKQRFINSRALLKTKEDVCLYVREAKKELDRLKDSCFKQSLFNLTDHFINKITT